METIPEEKAQEYREVAALVCLEVDLLAEVVAPDMTADSLRWHIAQLFAEKERLIADQKYRRERFAMMSVLFNLPVDAPAAL